MCVTEASAVIFSEFAKTCVVLSEPASIYWIYNLGCVVEVPSSKPMTLALTPEVAPVIVTGVVELKYWVGTSSYPANCDASCIEVYAFYMETWPGMTTVPSLKIFCPCLSIWFCRIDWSCVNSLAWTAKPGLKRTLWKLSLVSKSS